MSQGNVEIVRRVYAEWALGDFSEGDVFDPEVEFEMVDWPEAGKSRGLAEMRRTWGAALGAWDDFRAEPGEYIDLGDQVVVMTRAVGRGRGSGMEVSADTATVWTIDQGRIVRLALYWDSAKALAAVGLEDWRAEV
jgi:ketosteroid isomerase-like protein